jgi:hypothetical protein
MKKESVKFKLETKKGQAVYHVEVNMRDSASMLNRSSSNKQGIFITELKIIHQTPRKIALSDDYITLFDRQRADQKQDSYYRYLESVNVSIITKETYFPNGIFSSCYTLNDPNKCIAKIKQKICDKINKEYGFLRFVDIEEIIKNLEIINL